MGDQKFPKSLTEVLGVGYRKRLNLPPYGPLPPGGGLLQPVDPAAAPDPPAVSAEEAIDIRLATALASLENDDSTSIH